MDYYWICIREDCTAGLFKTGPKKVVTYDDFEYIKKECGMHWAETITFTYHNRAYQMLIDEEGKLNAKGINDIADRLYDKPYDVIVGDVAILSYPSGEDMTYLEEFEAMDLFEYIKACAE